MIQQAVNADLYTPPDILEVYESWKASCGPVALAAILSRPVMECRHLFPGYKGYVNPSMMTNALRLAGVKYRQHGGITGKQALLFIQIEGPWEAPGVPIAAAYKHTHWVANVGPPPMVFDVNLGGWEHGHLWEELAMERIVESHKRATGWRVRLGIEVME